MLAPTMRPCSCAVGSMAWTSGWSGDQVAPRGHVARRRRRSGRSSAGDRPRRCRRRLGAPPMPEPSSHSRLVADAGRHDDDVGGDRPPCANGDACACPAPPRSSSAWRPVRTVDAVLLEPRLDHDAPRTRHPPSAAGCAGATSTMVSLAPRERIEFRIVKAMKPAPTMTTWLPGVIAGDHAARLLERPEGVHAGPVGAGDRRLAPRAEPVAIRQSSYSTRAPSSRVHTFGFRVEARRPAGRAAP